MLFKVPPPTADWSIHFGVFRGVFVCRDARQFLSEEVIGGPKGSGWSHMAVNALKNIVIFRRYFYQERL
jgi:hypothetical protein